MIDIGQVGKYPDEQLSNFNQYNFVMDGVLCVSMEGFLQSLKYQDEEKQREICGLWGGNAKKKGSKKNKVWKKRQTLYWQGVEYLRESKEYDALIIVAFNQLAKNEKYQELLLAIGNRELTHSYGRDDKRETVLTEKEFCDMVKELSIKVQRKKRYEMQERIEQSIELDRAFKDKMKDRIQTIEYIPNVMITGRNAVSFEYEKPNNHWMVFEFVEDDIFVEEEIERVVVQEKIEEVEVEIGLKSFFEE